MQETCGANGFGDSQAFQLDFLFEFGPGCECLRGSGKIAHENKQGEPTASSCQLFLKKVSEV